MKNIKLTIEYDGTGYCGWQIQPNGTSIQQVIEECLLKLTGETIRIHGSGRTDSGVHAYGQTASFITGSSIPSESFNKALNYHLPSDISIISSTQESADFHARFSAKSKSYRYLIQNREVRSPFLLNRAYGYGGKINISAMISGAVSFQGTHDFKGFMSSGSDVKDTVRTIHELTVDSHDDIIEINVTGNGFLYNMVRIIAGTLLDCGIGKIDQENIPGIILAGDRKLAGPTLPAKGLYLVKVVY